METKKFILCVDDEPEILELTRMLLEPRGYNVQGALGGIEGLKMMRESKPDLVLLDLMMYDISGWELYQQMKSEKNLADVPVIMVTAKTKSVDKALGLHVAKVADYITKPFGPLDLIASVEKVLAENETSE